LAVGRKRHETINVYGQWPAAVSAYLACVTFADTMVGRLLDAIDGSPAAENTIIVLLGDNGWHLGEKRSWEKAKLWEESTHVPLIIAGPGFSPAQRRCGRPVSLLDVYPTLVELCGLTPKPELEGQSLRPLLANPETVWARPAVTFYRPYDFAVRSERFRYIRYRDGGEELYDHAIDPGEWTNLAADDAYAAVKQELEGWLPPPIEPQVRLPLIL
jgi:arylsulfatase A-like enzyme